MIETKILKYAKVGALKCWEELEKKAEIYKTNYWCNLADAAEKDYYYIKDLILSKKVKYAQEFTNNPTRFLCECLNNSERKEWVLYFSEEDIITAEDAYGLLQKIKEGAFDHADR